MSRCEAFGWFVSFFLLTFFYLSVLTVIRLEGSQFLPTTLIWGKKKIILGELGLNPCPLNLEATTLTSRLTHCSRKFRSQITTDHHIFGSTKQWKCAAIFWQSEISAMPFRSKKLSAYRVFNIYPFFTKSRLIWERNH